ncbi:unnamed protein product [Symbiodinium sp. KB8]|nr:unnamed protein product [Symbiodinium sp. KB8]
MEAANRVVLLEIKAGTMLPHDPAERISPPLMRKEEPAKTDEAGVVTRPIPTAVQGDARSAIGDGRGLVEKLQHMEKENARLQDQLDQARAEQLSREVPTAEAVPKERTPTYLNPKRLQLGSARMLSLLRDPAQDMQTKTLQKGLEEDTPEAVKSSATTLPTLVPPEGHFTFLGDVVVKGRLSVAQSMAEMGAEVAGAQPQTSAPSMNVVSLRAHRPMTGGIHAYALVDSGATHALRRASSQEEWEQADPVVVNLAGGESVALKINRAGTILVPIASSSSDSSPTSIVPLGALVQQLGYTMTWSGSRCRLEGRNGDIFNLRVREGCPELAEHDALQLISRLEDNNLKDLKAHIKSTRCKVRTAAMMMERNWFDYLLNYARGSIATEALKAIEAAPFLRDVPEPCKAGLVDAIPDMNGWEVLKGLKHLNRRTRKKLWCSDKWAVHLFAGEREKKEIWHLERHGYAVLELDISRGRTHNILLPSTWKVLEYAARMGKIAAVIGGPPQGTFMISRYNVNGPRQLRTNEYPFGNWQGQSDADVYTVNRESQLLVRMIYLHSLATAGYLAFGDPLYPGVVSFWRTSLWSEYALQVKMAYRRTCVDIYHIERTVQYAYRLEEQVGGVDPDARGTWTHYDSGDLSVEDYKDDDDGLALVEQPEEVPPPADEEERQEEDHEPGKKLDPEEDIDLAPPALVNLVFATGITDDKAATVLEAIQDVVLYCQAMNIPVLRFHSDRGMEFRAKATQQWLKGQGIRVTTSEAGVHQTNGAAESTVRWIKQRARTLLLSAGLPQHLWSTAITTAATMQRSDVLGFEPLLAAPYGSKVMVRKRQLEGPKQDDLIPKWIQGVYVGRSESLSKGHLVYVKDDEGEKFIHTLHVRAGLHDPGPLEEGVEADEPAGPHKRIRGKSSGAGDVVVLSKAMIFEDKQYQERAEQILKVWSQEEAEEFVEEVCGQLPASENVYGMFRHGGKAGVTKATIERPWFAKLLLRMLKDKAPEAEFAAVYVSINSEREVHIDRNNAMGTLNYLLPIAMPRRGRKYKVRMRLSTSGEENHSVLSEEWVDWDMLAKVQFEIEGEKVILVQGKVEPSWWAVQKGDSELIGIIVVYVDDVLICGPQPVIRKVAEEIGSIWKTSELQLASEGGDSSELVAYCDASFAPDGAKSHSGWLVFLNDCVISWKSGRQSTITLSTAEAELTAMSEAVLAIQSINAMLSDILPGGQRLQLYSDSTAALAIANGSGSWRTRHLRLRSAWVAELIENQDIMVHHCIGEVQPADLLTKALASQRMKALSTLMNLREPGDVEDEAGGGSSSNNTGSSRAHAPSKVSKGLIALLVLSQAARAETFNWEDDDALVVRSSVSVDYGLLTWAILWAAVIILLVAWELLKWLVWLAYDRATPGATTRRMKRLQKLRDATSVAIQKEIQSRSGSRPEQRRRDAELTPRSQRQYPPRTIPTASSSGKESERRAKSVLDRDELLCKLAKGVKETHDCAVQVGGFHQCAPSSQTRVILRYVHEPPEESFVIPGNECYHIYGDCYAFRHRGTKDRVERRRICQYCMSRSRDDPDKSADYGRDLERAKEYEQLFNTQLLTSGQRNASSSSDVP